MRYLLPLLCLLACHPAAKTDTDDGSASRTYPTHDAHFIRNDPAMDAVIPTDATVERLARGFNWSEGPLWLPEQEKLIFSDVPANQIYQWQEGDTETHAYLTPSGYTDRSSRGGESGSNGLTLDRNGTLLLCQHGDRRVARMSGSLDEPKPIFETLADKHLGQRFNSPNDLCVNAAGQIFFTDPPYGLPPKDRDAAKEIPFQGVYRIDPDGSVQLLLDSLTRPNGIALSPDERTLYVAVSDREAAQWMAYQLDAEGNILSGGVFYDATEMVGKDHPGLPDGMKVDAQGIIFATGPGGLWIFAPDATVLGRVETGLPTSNCALAPGYVYLTADSLLLRVQRIE